MSNTFKTKEGTVLPLMDLKGKPYLQVAHRIVWFREEHPTWPIRTTVTIETHGTHDIAVGKAEISDEKGTIIATATKWEPLADLAPEKAETGAIGRALGFLGYGTQFANDIDEGDRIADAPVAVAKPTVPNKAPQFKKPEAPKVALTTLSDEQIGFGKYKGKTFGEVGVIDLSNYTDYLKGTAKKEGKPLSGASAHLVQQADYWFEEQAYAQAPKLDDTQQIPF